MTLIHGSKVAEFREPPRLQKLANLAPPGVFGVHPELCHNQEGLGQALWFSLSLDGRFRSLLAVAREHDTQQKSISQVSLALTS